MSSKLLLAILGVIACQAVLFVILISGQGILVRLDESAFDTFNERVSSVQDGLENEMVQRWSNIGTQAEVIAEALEQYMRDNGVAYEEIKAQPELTTAFLQSVTEEVIFMMRKTSVSGGFLVMDYGLDGDNDLCGLHLSDSDPNHYPADDSDLLLDVGPASIAKSEGIPLNTSWVNRYQLKEGDEASRFFYKPYQAAQANTGMDIRKLGYWSGAHQVTATSPEVISYSLPVVLSDGQVVGVLGIDLQTDYLMNYLPYKLLQAERNGVYVLGIRQADEQPTVKPVTYNGPLYKHMVGERPTQISFLPQPIHSNVYELQDGRIQNETVYGSIAQLKIYDNNGPFADEQWVIVGLVEKKHLLALSSMVVRSIWFAALVTLFFAVIISILTARQITKPIGRMIDELRQSDPAKEVILSKTDIQEVDELAQAVENLSRNVADSASKLSQIIDLLDMSIGAFEYDKRDDRVYCTAVMLTFLGIDANDNGYLEQAEFNRRLQELMKQPEEDSEDTYRIDPPTDQIPIWLRISQLENELTAWGVIMDVTDEIIEKQRIQYERDYDLLTHLLNRRAFVSQVRRKFAEGNVGTAVFAMWDLDGLKYINDTYGHDYGDEYIQKAATVLQGCSRYGGLVARMSGDEFYVFIDHIDDREVMFQNISAVHKELLAMEMQMSNGNIIRLSASVGLAWCPNDAKNYDTLVRYADFAMYQAKRAQKGSIRQFERESYERDAFLLSSKEDMDRLINEELVHYVYQPIVSAKTGEILAYEALMRTDLETLKSPQDVLRLAKYLVKLHEMEWLTFNGALKGYAQQAEAFGDAKLFINSIPNVCLSQEQIAQLERNYQPYLSKVVLEMIESERTDENSTRIKQEAINRWQGEIALDDFGAGYNNDLVLLTLMPVYVKIDMALVSGIAHDSIRQNIIRNLLGYFANTEVKTIAEGVETAEDMAVLIDMGIDYLQGYYLGRPSQIPQSIPQTVVEEIKAMAAGRKCE